jgi:hypothetical protein
MKVLQLRFGQEIHEIHLLNVGEVFEGFGGSKHPLVAGRNFATGEKQKKPTASLIVRRRGVMGIEDKELDIHNPNFWAWMARMLNGGEYAPDEATVDPARTVAAGDRAEGQIE